MPRLAGATRPESFRELEMPHVAGRRSFWVAPAWVCLSVTGTLALAIGYATRHQIDFDIYRMGAAHVLGQHLYDVRLSRALMGGSPGMPFTYPPFAAFLFLPFTPLSVPVGQVAWSVINILALTALTAWSIRAVRPDWPPRRIWVGSTIVLLPVVLLDPDNLTLSFGQINFFIALLVLLDLTSAVTWRSRTLPRGVLLGIAAAIKLTPLIFIAFLFLTRQFRAGVTALVTFLACSLGCTRHSAPLRLALLVNRDLRGPPVGQSPVHKRPESSQRAPAHDRCAAATDTGGTPHRRLRRRWSGPGGLGLPLLFGHPRHRALCSDRADHLAYLVGTSLRLGGAGARLASPRTRPSARGAVVGIGVAVLFWAAPLWWVSDIKSGYGGPLTILAGNSFFLAAVAFLLAAGLMLWWRRRAPDGAVFAGLPLLGRN